MLLPLILVGNGPIVNDTRMHCCGKIDATLAHGYDVLTIIVDVEPGWTLKLITPWEMEPFRQMSRPTGFPSVILEV